MGVLISKAMDAVKKLTEHLDQLTIWLKSFANAKIPSSLKIRAKNIFEKILAGDELSDDEWIAIAPKPFHPTPKKSSSKKKPPKGKKSTKKQTKQKHKNIIYTDKRYYNEQSEEKRLDGSPNSYTSREKGRYGSYPTHDNFDDNSKP